MTAQQSMLEYIETALEDGLLFARMANGNLWKCRRNGKTRAWKTRPGHFEIPIKAGFRATGTVRHTSTVGLPGDGKLPDFIVERIAGGQRFNCQGPRE